MITEWRQRILAREQARVAEHQPDEHGWCAGCLAYSHVEEWPCHTVGTAVLAVRQLQRQLEAANVRHPASDTAGRIGPETDRLGIGGLARPQVHDGGHP